MMPAAGGNGNMTLVWCYARIVAWIRQIHAP